MSHLCHMQVPSDISLYILHPAEECVLSSAESQPALSTISHVIRLEVHTFPAAP